MRATITIVVNYDEATVSDRDSFEMNLEREVDRMVENGMLSPTGEEIVDEFSVDVEVKS